MATTEQRKLRNERILKEHEHGICISRIASNNKVTPQTVRNIVSGKFKDRSGVEKEVLKEWQSAEGEFRHKLSQVSDKTGLKKTQVRYIILKNDKSR